MLFEDIRYKLPLLLRYLTVRDRLEIGVKNTHADQTFGFVVVPVPFYFHSSLLRGGSS